MSHSRRDFLTKRLLNGLLTGMALMLTACGWHLQGNRQVGAQVSPLYVQSSDEHSELVRALTVQLRASGVVLTASPTEARTVLTIVGEESGHHVSAVSALNEPQQYEVFYRVRWRVEQAGQSQPEQHGEDFSTGLSRTMNYDKTTALAMQRQEQTLVQRLADDLADQMVLKLGFVTRAAP